MLETVRWRMKNLLSSIMRSNRPISFFPPYSSSWWWAILEHLTPVSLWNGASNRATASLKAWLHRACKAAACHSHFSCHPAALALFPLTLPPLAALFHLFPYLCSSWVAEALNSILQQTADGRQRRERRSCVSAGSPDGGQSCPLRVLLLFICSHKQHFTFHPWEPGATWDPWPLTRDPIGLIFHPSAPVVMVSVPMLAAFSPRLHLFMFDWMTVP